MTVNIITGDCRDVLATLPAESVQTCVTSPPYFGLRDYGTDNQIGLEASPDEFVSQLVAVFREVRRVLKNDGTLWLNLGDSYAGSWGAQGRRSNNVHAIDCDLDEDCRCAVVSDISATQVRAAPHRMRRTGSIPAGAMYKAKDIYGIPWRVAFALQADGWYLRQDIIWHKPNPMPESVTDRCTKAHEYLFLLAKSERYYYDAEAIAEPSSGVSGGGFGAGGKEVGRLRRDAERERPKDDGLRNRRSVWTVTTKPFSGAHFATFPPDLIAPCILAGSRPGDLVLDPFGGAGTTGLVADRLGRNATLIELNPEYAALATKRITQDAPLFVNVTDTEAAIT